MKSDEAKKTIDQALAKLLADLQAGKSESLTRYLRTLARFHRYSFGNVLLILCQRPSATHVAGFRRWRELGRFVRKGEKGIAIFAPMRVRSRDRDARSEDELETWELRFRVVHVFDIEQTKGEPLPTLDRTKGDPGDNTVRLKAFLVDRGIGLDYAPDLGGADGVSHKGRISIRSGLEPPEEFSVLVHETAHELLHHGEGRPGSKTVRETEAEAVAFAVCSALGLEAHTAARDYIQLYQGTTETLAASLERVRDTASAILNALLMPRSETSDCGHGTGPKPPQEASNA